MLFREVEPSSFSRVLHAEQHRQHGIFKAKPEGHGKPVHDGFVVHGRFYAEVAVQVRALEHLSDDPVHTGLFIRHVLADRSGSHVERGEAQPDVQNWMTVHWRRVSQKVLLLQGLLEACVVAFQAYLVLVIEDAHLGLGEPAPQDCSLRTELSSDQYSGLNVSG